MFANAIKNCYYLKHIRMVCMNLILFFCRCSLTMHMMFAPYKDREPQPFWNLRGIKSRLSSWCRHRPEELWPAEVPHLCGGYPWPCRGLFYLPGSEPSLINTRKTCIHFTWPEAKQLCSIFHIHHCQNCVLKVRLATMRRTTQPFFNYKK